MYVGKFGAMRAPKIFGEMTSNRLEQIVVKGHKEQRDVTFCFLFVTSWIAPQSLHIAKIRHSPVIKDRKILVALKRSTKLADALVGIFLYTQRIAWQLIISSICTMTVDLK